MPVKRFWTCWFCKKTRDKVKVLIAGPDDICICNECVELCNKLLADDDYVNKLKKKEKKDA